MNTEDININALLPRTLLLFATLIIACCLAVPFTLLPISTTAAVSIAAITAIIICHIPKVQSNVTILLAKTLIWVHRCVNKLWQAFVADPYRPFAISIVVSIVAIIIVLTLASSLPFLSSVEGLTSTNTFVMTLLGMFIPFVFAATSFVQNRLAERVPRVIAHTTLRGATGWIWFFLVLVFMGALSTPFLGLQRQQELALQITMVACAFLVVVFYVLGVLRLADDRHLLPYFRKKAEGRLTKSFLKEGPLSHIPGAALRHSVATHILGRLSQSNVLRLGPTSVSKDSTDEAFRTFEALFLMVKRALRDDSVSDMAFALREAASYASKYYWLRQKHISWSDSFDHYMGTELEKLVATCATKESEKFLDTIIHSTRTIALSACQYQGIGGSTSRNPLMFIWEELLCKTAIQTSGLEHTLYSIEAIRLLGDLGADGLRRGHIRTVQYGTIDRLKRLGEQFAASKWQGHSVMVNQALASLNTIFLAFASEVIRFPGYLHHHFLEGCWLEAATDVVKAKLANYTPDSFESVLSFPSRLQWHSPTSC